MRQQYDLVWARQTVHLLVNGTPVRTCTSASVVASSSASSGTGTGTSAIRGGSPGFRGGWDQRIRLNCSALGRIQQPTKAKAHVLLCVRETCGVARHGHRATLGHLRQSPSRRVVDAAV